MSDVVTSTSAVDPEPAPGARSTAAFGVIVFLASDVMLFAAFFAAYFLLRADNAPWPPEGVELEVPRAAAATLTLIASSFTMEASDRAAEHPGGMRATRRWLLITIALGALFLANQISEYAALSFSADDHPYGSIYWLLTGLHGAHVTAGLGALSLLFVRSVRSGSLAAIAPWQAGVSLFWHLVDLVWIFVFVTIWVLQ
jgi:cytochrome c oxidase subunit 3